MGCLGCIIASTASSVNTIVGGTVFIGLAAAVQLNFPAIISECGSYTQPIAAVAPKLTDGDSGAQKASIRVGWYHVRVFDRVLRVWVHYRIQVCRK